MTPAPKGGVEGGRGAVADVAAASAPVAVVAAPFPPSESRMTDTRRAGLDWVEAGGGCRDCGGCGGGCRSAATHDPFRSRCRGGVCSCSRPRRTASICPAPVACI